MKLWLALTLSALLGYLFGNLNGAILISRLVKHEDVRTHGSGNAGLTNFLRSYGGAVTLIVVLIDFGKTVAACLLATLFLPRDPLLAKIVAGAGVQLGHVFPVFFGFHGGKGILCGAAIALVTDWRVFVIAMPVFILLFFATRLVSLASLTAVACFGVLYAVFYPARPEIWIITICEAAFAFVMHSGNIFRLLHGQERKTYFHRAKNERNE